METQSPTSSSDKNLTVTCANQREASRVKPLFIGVTGGTASGKTSLCDRIAQAFAGDIAMVSLDMFYKGLSDEEHEDAANYNFDHPNALDFDLAFEKLTELLSGKDCKIPTYDFALHKRTKVTSTVKTAPIIIFEGIHANLESRFRDLMDLRIFVLTPDDIRLSRRISRDIAERGRTVVDVLAQYNRFVKPAYDDFIKPTMRHADIIIPFDTKNDKAIEMLIQNLKIKMRIMEQQQNCASGRPRSVSDVLTPLASRHPEQLQPLACENDCKIALPSEKVQAKVAKLLESLVSLQSPSSELSEDLRHIHSKLLLKELSIRLLKHYREVAKNPVPPLETSSPQLIFKGEVGELPTPTSEVSHVLAFQVPSSLVAGAEEQSIVALAQSSAAGTLSEETLSLASAIFAKAVRKQYSRLLKKQEV